MKAAVIGLGRMGRRHLDNVKALGMQLVGVVDPRPSSASSAVQEGAVTPELVFSSAEALFERGKPEVVIVATTAPAHAPLTIMAARAGARFVLCEKPMATSLTDCQHMIDACARSGTRLAVNHQMRVMEQYTYMKKLVAEPEFGGLSSITVVAGNFGLAMNGIHYFELFRWITGESPASVSAWLSPAEVPNPRGAEFSDRGGSVRVTTASGRRLNLECGPEQGHGIRVVYAGPYGMAVSDELRGTISVSVRQEGDRALPTTRYGMPSVQREVTVTPADALMPSRQVLEELVGGHDYPTGEDGRVAVATLVAAFVSAESGATVPVDATLPVGRSFNYA